MKRERFNFNASVFAVLSQNGQFLGVKRGSTGWLDGYWSLPAGAHDGGESFMAGALRELHEETGLRATEAGCRLLHVQQVFVPEGEWQALYFGVEAWEGEPQLREPEKHEQVEWINFSDEKNLVVPYVSRALECISKGENFSVFRMT